MDTHIPTHIYKGHTYPADIYSYPHPQMLSNSMKLNQLTHNTQTPLGPTKTADTNSTGRQVARGHSEVIDIGSLILYKLYSSNLNNHRHHTPVYYSTDTHPCMCTQLLCCSLHACWGQSTSHSTHNRMLPHSSEHTHNCHWVVMYAYIGIYIAVLDAREGQCTHDKCTHTHTHSRHTRTHATPCMCTV